MSLVPILLGELAVACFMQLFHSQVVPSPQPVWPFSGSGPKWLSVARAGTDIGRQHCNLSHLPLIEPIWMSTDERRTSEFDFQLSALAALISKGACRFNFRLVL